MEFRYLIIIAALVSLCITQSDGILHNKVYIDGPDGNCELFTPRNLEGEPLSQSLYRCKTGWERKNTIDLSYGPLEYKPTCKYSQKTLVEECHDRSAGKPRLTCTRKSISYNIHSSCQGLWLVWEECDRTCGGGVATRVKITPYGRQNLRETESRPCNTHPCPVWGDWAPNAGEACNLETFTKSWQRACVYNGTISRPQLCQERRTDFGAFASANLSAEGYAVVNSTHQIRPCALRECLRPSTTPLPTITHSNTTAELADEFVTRNATMVGFGVGAALPPESVSNDRGLPTSGGNTIWMGIGISAIIALAIFSIGCFALGKRNKSSMSFFKRPFRRRFTPERKDSIASYVGGMRTTLQTQSTMESGEYLHPVVRQMLGTPPEPPARTTRTAPDVANHRTDGIGVFLVSPNPVPCPTAAPTHEDPIYSDIPLQQALANPQNIPPTVAVPPDDRGHDADLSSEFDCTDELSSNPSAPYKSSNSSDPANDSQETDEPEHQTSIVKSNAEDGCKSFDSDEDRDVVNTLRKTSRKLRLKRMNERGFNRDAEANLSEEEMELDHMSERRNAFEARHSKIQAKRYRNNMKAEGLVLRGPDFSHNGKHFLNHRTEKYPGPVDPTTPRLGKQAVLRSHSSGQLQRLSFRRPSSGTSSNCSFLFDATTSGYNSAFGDSSDGDAAFYEGHTNHIRPPPRRESPFARDRFHSSRRSIDSRLPMEIPSLHGLEPRRRIRQRSASSLYNHRSSVADSARPRWSSFKLRNGVEYGGMLPRSAHDVSSRANFHTEVRNKKPGDRRLQNNQIEDKYVNPFDAMPDKVQEVVYSTYNVPFNYIP